MSGTSNSWQNAWMRYLWDSAFRDVNTKELHVRRGLTRKPENKNNIHPYGANCIAAIRTWYFRNKRETCLKIERGAHREGFRTTAVYNLKRNTLFDSRHAWPGKKKHYSFFFSIYINTADSQIQAWKGGEDGCLIRSRTTKCGARNSAVVYYEGFRSRKKQVYL